MMTIDTITNTRIDEIADDIYRISTPIPPEVIPGGFTFNQFLIVDDFPLLYHTGPRKMFASIREAIASVIPVTSLRYVCFSHFEADECGALNDFLQISPDAEPLCSNIAKMVSVDDVALKTARGLADGEELSLGRHVVRWIDTPHLPHAWECGHLFEITTKTLFCGDLFTQGGHEHEPLTTVDILEPSEKLRNSLDYFSHSNRVYELTEKLAINSPDILACMHGASWKGDGAALLRQLAKRLAA
jgi:flavorubredoxin